MGGREADKITKGLAEELRRYSGIPFSHLFEKGLPFMAQAVLEQDLVFGEIAIRNHLLSVQQVAECLRTFKTHGSKLSRGLPDICLQRGFLTPAQVQGLVRARNFLIRHREDLGMARELHRQNLVQSREIRTCFQLQQKAYYEGALSIPRLLDILDKEKLLSRGAAEVALTSGQKVLVTSEPGPGDSGCLASLLEPIAEDEVQEGAPAEGIGALPEELEEPGDRESALIPVFSGLAKASPKERGRFRIEEIREQSPENQPESAPPAPGPSQDRPPSPDASSREEKPVIVPRAYYRFPVRDSFVEYESSSWMPFLSAQAAHSPLLDVSLGGLQIFSRHPLEIGDKLLLDVHIPFLRRHLRPRGEVRWRVHDPESKARYRVGIEFVRLSRSDSECLKRLANSPALCRDKKKRKISI